MCALFDSTISGVGTLLIHIYINVYKEKIKRVHYKDDDEISE
jgi:hypothetical protein